MPASFAEIQKYIQAGGSALSLVPAWVLHGLAEIGTHEVKGAKNNPRIVEYWKEAGGEAAKVNDDETPWCWAFVSAMLRRSGVGIIGGGLAKSYLKYGTALDVPVLGAIVVLDRPPNPAYGHIFFCAGYTRDSIFGLGGNQGDKVSIAEFPRRRLASGGLRWPAEVPLIGTSINLPPSAVDPSMA